VNAGDTLREITIEEIKYVVEAFGKAAAGAREAGFDFVEIHNAHGLLPCQFFSPITNKRTDEYGGDLKRRMRFGTECARAMREAVGNDFPLFARQGVIDVPPNGLGLDEGIVFAGEMVKAGIDVLNVSLATPPFQAGYIPAGEDPEGTHVHLAAAVKAKVSVPVVAVGRIKSPAFAESILARGDADIIAIGRQLIADPYWPQKAANGRADEIVPCIDCHECYKAIAVNGVQCTVNYCASREPEKVLQATQAPKRVFIVGGGPAGMEAARIAAKRGHQVTLCEKGSQLGGAMLLQAMIPTKDPVENLTRYLKKETAEAGVKVELGKIVTPESIKNRNPDAIIFAPGANPPMPDIPGINRENVINSGYLREMMCGCVKNGIRIRSGWREILIRLSGIIFKRPLPLAMRNKLADIGIPIIFGKRVVVMGGDLTACQLADLLSDKRRKVTIVATEAELAMDLPTTLQNRLLGRLEKKKVTVIKGIKKYDQITDSGLVIVDKGGNRQTIAADTFIPMISPKGSSTPDQKWMEAVPEVYLAGDYAEPLKLLHAIHDGAKAGRII
jgi:NADPH-dependent 2,4-dienoyl-CoA reductase/sulfur reductase-like enzyme